MSEAKSTLKLAQPDWSSVRSIYKKLSEDFHILTQAYQIKLSPQRKLMLDHLIIGIDTLDGFIDDLPEKNQRDSITKSLTAYLRHKETPLDHRLADSALKGNMNTLKLIVHELKIEDRFVDAAEAIFHNTEIKRHTSKQKDLLNYIMLEGAATAELPLSFMGVSKSHPFASFFRNLCKLMGIADLIVDARDDYKSKRLLYKPNLSLYFNLNIILIKEGLKLIWNFPDKFQFLLYCIRFSWLLITSKD